jgi:hypothetical protein
MRIVLISLVLLLLQVKGAFLFAPGIAVGERIYGQHENSKEQHDHDEHKEGHGKKEDEGNEASGQVAAWLLVSANLPVVLSILTKGVTRFLSLSSEKKTSLKKFNQFQKQCLMRFHYLLNLLALCAAFFHFLLSSCRSSSLQEWGLILILIMVGLGLVLKFKVAPSWMRRMVHRLHTTPAAISVMILLLVVGHLSAD